MNEKIKKISTNLWFDTQAEAAVKSYTSIFKNSKLGRITHYGKTGYEIHGMPEGLVMTVEFQLEGQNFVALNGGPEFRFNEAISFIVNCDNQEEIDYYWDNLTEGGDQKAQVCGWLKDKYGVSWQVIPSDLQDMLNNPDTEKSERVTKALLQTKGKIDINTLKRAFEE